MKNYSSIKNTEPAYLNPPFFHKIKSQQTENESPLRLDLKFKLNNNHLHTNPSNFKTKQSASKSKEKQQQSTELLLTQRTNGVNQFTASNKQSVVKGSNIKSYLRIKPSKNNSPFLETYNNQTIFHQRTTYKFDYIFSAQTAQNIVYSVVGMQVTNNFLQGYNGTIFAYGSTGSGKTYTMFGNDDGLVPSVVQNVFAKLQPNSKLSCSMIEIYKQNLIDLLSGNSDQELKIKDINNNCVVNNLSIHELRSKQEALNLISKGNILKKIRETDLNESSSRSHIVFTLYLQKNDSQGRPIKCKFNLVDLAGSEKVFKSKVQGEGLQQAKKINLSLSCLGNTISALVKNSDHIPYRESKLTRILKESLMGNSITRLIVTCCMNEQSIQETISSMKFAQRAQRVQTQAQVAYNANRFKGEKQERQKYIRQALDQFQSDYNKISSIINKQECNCNNCVLVKQIIAKKPMATHMFTFNPINTIASFKSPKETIDIRSYFSNGSLQKFSTKQQQKKRSLIKNGSLYHREGLLDNKQVMNKKNFQLKNENDKLKQQKSKLQMRIKILEDKTAEKDTKNERNQRKVIRLGVGCESRPSRLNTNKQNQPNAINKVEQPPLKQKKTFGAVNDLLQPPTQSKANNSHPGIALNQIISKLQVAVRQYHNTVYPVHIQILNEQILMLQKQLQHQPEPKIDLCRYFSTLIDLQKKMCNYIDELSPIISTLFQNSRSEYKQQLSQTLNQRLKQISDIKWSMKEFYEQSDQISEINTLLKPLKIGKNEVQLSLDSLLQQNQFLNMNSVFPTAF